MVERKYSVAEIDRMRAALGTRWRLYAGYFSAERGNRDVEDQLRTYMLNGTDPAELDAAVEQEAKKLAKKHAEMRRMYPAAFQTEEAR